MNAALASCSHKDDRRNDRRERGGRPNPWLIHGRLFRADSESLECRRLLTSVSFNVGTGALLVTGDSTADTISIETVSGTIKVWDTTDDAVNPLWTRSPESDVQTIVVSAGGGADTVTVQGSVSSSIETTLKGEAGNDTLTGGRGDDRLEGGADNDTYKFTGSSDLSSTAGDYVVEASIAGTDNSVDVLDFSGFANGLDELDLADAVNVQHVALTDVSPTRPSLHLKLSDGNGIENVIGSEANAGQVSPVRSDSIIGNARPNRIEGRGGEDWLDGAGGRDTILGGDEHDCARGGADNDLIYGEGGADHLGNHDIPETGEDTIFGGAGNDDIMGGDDDDWLYGDAGDDDIEGEGAGDHIFGGSSSTGNDTLDLGGNDTLLGGEGADFIYGGDDSVNGSIKGDSIDGGTDGDQIWGDFVSMASTLYGNVDEGDDTISGGDGADTIKGDSGNINSGFGGGHDSISGGPGGDLIYGESGLGSGSNRSGKDTIEGGPDNDTMVGEDDNDTYDFNVLEDGSLGVDSITEGADSIVGSDGGDLLDFTDVQPHTSVNGITLDISITSEQTLTTLGQLKLRLSSGTGIERVNGSDHATRGNDSIIGNSLANIISGKKGNDTIRGGSGSDTLRGDDGDDQFYAADSATDSLDGGLGTDSARLLLTERDSFDAVTSIENS